MRTAINPILPLTLLLPILLSCGTEEKPPASATGDYFPLAVGDWWLFEEDEGEETTQVRYEIVDFTNMTFGHGIGARDVYVVENTFPTGDTGSDTDAVGGWRVQYYFDDGSRVDRLRHEVYDDDGNLTKTRDYVPGFLRYDRSKLQGDEWAEELDRYSDSTPEDTTDDVLYEPTSYLFEVLPPETVTVPAGTFDCAVWKRTETDNTGEIKMYYYAPNVGKVKEVTGDKIEVLLEYHVAAAVDAGA